MQRYGRLCGSRFALAIEPRRGIRILPDRIHGARRGSRSGGAAGDEEEAGAELDELFSLLSVPHVNHVRLICRARLDRVFAAGVDKADP
jgi:hypothetical protein